MRVFCPECGEKARIQKTNRISTSYADLYCSCSDPECGHSFVMNLSFSHTLSPSAKNTNELVTALVKALPHEKVKEIHSQLAMF
ncbi:ogr/Delta-like zinc finger family protein [Photobacterium lipolyticum]|uniref:Transcriptional regulator n=1 Tax=Photobacterium lipolyticum TaxID=266810 RepID=A0A2T3N0B5_9GAMM|nr:ogr/Delta-like zinc finger family protein [Photobacterium lipolyticum]PSW05650.1 transcriptional regulator [Photobacterium lipolyticum]